MTDSTLPATTADGHYIVIIEFDVEPAQQRALIDGLTAEAERSFWPDAAFISATFLASLDGRRVVNYAQWTSERAYAAFMDGSKAAQSVMAEVIQRCGARPAYRNTYRAERIIAAGPK
jgi:quinol monooxygenase YgiN